LWTQQNATRKKRKQKSRRRCSVAGGERARKNKRAARETHIPISAAGEERRRWGTWERENIVWAQRKTAMYVE